MLTDDRIIELMSALEELEGQDWGKNDYKMSRELFKMIERLMILEEKYRVGGCDEDE